MIQRADPRARRRAMGAALISGVLLLALVVVANRWLAGVQQRPPEEGRAALAAALLWSSLGVGILVSAFGVHLFARGRRTVSAERFPPPGVTVIRDTPILEGPAARRRGLLMQALAGALILAFLAFCFAAYRLAAYLS